MEWFPCLPVLTFSFFSLTLSFSRSLFLSLCAWRGVYLKFFQGVWHTGVVTLLWLVHLLAIAHYLHYKSTSHDLDLLSCLLVFSPSIGYSFRLGLFWSTCHSFTNIVISSLQSYSCSLGLSMWDAYPLLTLLPPLPLTLTLLKEPFYSWIPKLSWNLEYPRPPAYQPHLSGIIITIHLF